MKKTTKISVLALFALSFALVFCGCSNTKDETETEQGGEAGSGDETGGTGDSNNDSENPDDPNAPKTKFTNSAWNKAVEKQYDGVYIDVSSIDYPENFDFSEYDFLKVNVTFSKGGEEVTTAWGTGFAHLQKKNGDSYDNLLTISNINNEVSSKYNSAWFPIAMLKEVPAQLAVQSAEGGDKIDLVTVNYIEFVKIGGVKATLLPELNTAGFIKKIVDAGSSGDTVVFGITYDGTLKPYDYVAAIQKGTTWSDKYVIVSGEEGNWEGDEPITPGYIQNCEMEYNKVKEAYDAGFDTLSGFKKGSALQYVYIK